MIDAQAPFAILYMDMPMPWPASATLSLQASCLPPPLVYLCFYMYILRAQGMTSWAKSGANLVQ